LSLGIKHPDYLGLDAKQMMDWWTFYEVHPWGEEVEDLRHGVNTAAIVNMLRSKGPAAKPQAFMVHKPEKKQQTWQEMKREARRIALVTGGKIMKKSQSPSGN
jgi:hypothetical protein